MPWRALDRRRRFLWAVFFLTGVISLESGSFQARAGLPDFDRKCAHPTSPRALQLGTPHTGRFSAVLGRFVWPPALPNDPQALFRDVLYGRGSSTAAAGLTVEGWLSVRPSSPGWFSIVRCGIFSVELKVGADPEQMQLVVSMKTSTIGGQTRHRFPVPVELVSPVFVEPFRWTHVACVYDGSFLKLLVQGSLVAYTAVGPPLNPSEMRNDDEAGQETRGGQYRSLNPEQAACYFGSSSLAHDTPFSASLTDVGVWRTALSPSLLSSVISGDNSRLMPALRRWLVAHWTFEAGVDAALGVVVVALVDAVPRGGSSPRNASVWTPARPGNVVAPEDPQCHLEDSRDETKATEIVPPSLFVDSDEIADCCSRPRGATHDTPVNGRGVPMGLFFDGQQSKVIVPSPFQDSFEELTVEAWFKTSSDTTTFQSIISSVDKAFKFVHLQLCNVGSVSVYDDASSHPTVLRCIEPHPYNVWRHVAIVYALGGNITSYHNGEAFENVEPSWSDPGPRKVSNSASPFLLIGAGHSYQRHFHGFIRDVRLWSSARNQRQIVRSLFRIEPTPAEQGDLLAHWPLSEGKGRVASDLSSHARHGSILGAWWKHTPLHRAFSSHQGRVEHGPSSSKDWKVMNGDQILTFAQKLEDRDILLLEFAMVSGYAPWHHKQERQPGGGHYTELENCSVGCSVAADHSLISLADAVVSEPVVYSLANSPMTVYEKEVGQQWGYYQFENADADSVALSDPHLLRKYDIQATYEPSSNVRVTLMCTHKNDFPNQGDIGQYLKPPKEKNAEHVVAFVTSNCDSRFAVKRTAYVKELMEHIEVHSYGKCLNNRDFPPPKDGQSYWHRKIDLLSNYKFVLAFENHDFPHYVTEKIFHAFIAGVVPVYMGTSHVKEYYPSDRAVVNAADFASAKDLADYLVMLNNNDDLYMEYFDWKYRPLPQSFRDLHASCTYYSFCRVCEKVAELRRNNPDSLSQKASRNVFPNLSGSGFALSFPRRGDIMVVSDAGDILLSQSFAVAFWVKMENLGTNPQSRSRFTVIQRESKKAEQSISIGFLIKTGMATTVLCRCGQCFAGEAGIMPNVWNFVSVTFDSTSHRVDFFLNGVFDLFRFVPPGRPSLQIPSYAPVTIGHHRHTEANGRHGEGWDLPVFVDSLSFWNRTLSDVEAVNDIMLVQLSGAEEGLVAYWNFDEGNGPSAASVGQQQHISTGSLLRNSDWVFSRSKPIPFKWNQHSLWRSKRSYPYATVANEA